jgi:vacuolar-type H+-ATPase subunit H
MGTEKLPPEPQRPSAKAAERLAVIVDAAERAALSVIDDAEKEAQRYLEEAKARADLIAAERLRDTADEIEHRHGASNERREASERDHVLSQDQQSDEDLESEDFDAATSGPRLRSISSPAAPGREAEEAAADGEALPSGGDDHDLMPSEEPEGPAGNVRAIPSRQPGSAAARLLATQMAVSGSSRKEIEMRLRSGFEIEDTGEILDAILGPEE